MALYSSSTLICLISLQKPHDPKCLHTPDLKWTNNLDCTERVIITIFKLTTHRGLLETSCVVRCCFAVKLPKYSCGLKHQTSHPHLTESSPNCLFLGELILKQRFKRPGAM